MNGGSLSSSLAGCTILEIGEQPGELELRRRARIGVGLARRLRIDADVAKEALERVVSQLGGDL